MRAAWQRLKSHAQARIHAPQVPIFGSDVSFRMVDFARRNAARAGVADATTFNGGDALERPAPTLAAALPGTLMVNPPYGERIAPLGSRAAARATMPIGPRSRTRPQPRTQAIASCRATSTRASRRTGNVPTRSTRAAGPPGC